MMTYRLASAIAVILALFAIAPATQAAGKILATVNGVEIRDGIIQMTQQLEQMTDEQRKQYTDNIVAIAINQELLYQAAVAKELDKDPGYLVELENKRMIQQNRENAMFVNLYEQSIPELSTDGDEISTEEIETEYQKHKKSLAPRSREQAEPIIRDMLASMQRQVVYPDWVTSVVTKNRVKVNGKPLDAALFADAIKYNLGSETGPQKKETLLALSSAIIQLAGLQLPGDLTARDAADTAAFCEGLASVTLSIGPTELKLGDVPFLDSALINPHQLGIFFLSLVKSHSVRNQAMSKGFDNTPEYKDKMAMIANQTIGSLEQRVLARFFLERSVEITDAEIDEFYEEYGDRDQFYRLSLQPNSDELVRERIAMTLRHKKIQETRMDVLKELRAAATIENL